LDNANVLEKAGLSSNHEDIQDKAIKTITGPFASQGEFQLIVRNDAIRRASGGSDQAEHAASLQIELV
jgi:hypothetical protein